MTWFHTPGSEISGFGGWIVTETLYVLQQVFRNLNFNPRLFFPGCFVFKMVSCILSNVLCMYIFKHTYCTLSKFEGKYDLQYYLHFVIQCEKKHQKKTADEKNPHSEDS